GKDLTASEAALLKRDARGLFHKSDTLKQDLIGRIRGALAAKAAGAQSGAGRSESLLSGRLRPRHLANLVQIADVHGNRYVGRVTIVEEVREPDLRRNRADHLVESRQLQILHLPDFQHECAEFRADEAELSPVNVDAVEVPCAQGVEQRGLVQGNRAIEENDEVKDVGQVAP